jgi:hypothetical protein
MSCDAPDVIVPEATSVTDPDGRASGEPKRVPDSAEVSAPVVSGLDTAEGDGVLSAQILRKPPASEWLIVAEMGIEISPVAALNEPSAAGMRIVSVSEQGVDRIGTGPNVVVIEASSTAV